jgi:hypothetical protein
MIKKNPAAVMIIGASMLSVGILLFTNYRTSKLRKQKAVQDAILHFSTDSATRHLGFDSVYAANDTVSYYKLGILTGRSVMEYH